MLLPGETATESAEVQKILKQWLQSDVSLVAPRQGWAKLNERQWAQIAAFLREKDQTAMCQYVLTGELQDRRALAQVGSTVMFSIPPKGELCPNPSPLRTVCPEALLRECRTANVDVITAMETMLRRRVENLRNALVNGHLTMEV
jgi:hypothetical protein